MGALALPFQWIPEDDFLLKNAIEAGASLESLAKGAVQFSRRFTIKELQDRWLALLYDPTISTRAAEQMVELERSAANLPSKSNRADSLKGIKNAHGKRKAESVRKCYYAIRKKVCNEPFNPNDISFLGANCFMGTDGPVPGNMLGDPIASHFGVEGAEFDDLFSPVMRDGAPPCAVGEFPIEQHNTFEDHMEQNTTLPNNMAIEEIPGNDMFQGTGIQTNPGCSGKTILYSGFEGNTIFNPSVSDCDNSLQHLHYASPPPAISDWKTSEGISMTEMPDDIGIGAKHVQTGDPFVIPDDGDAGVRSEYDVMHAEMDLKDKGSSPGFFDRLSESLLGFGCDEDMMFDDDGDVKGDGKTYFDDFQLLLDCPNDVSEEQLPNVLKAKELDVADTYIDISSPDYEEHKNPVYIHVGDSNVQTSLDSQMPASASCVNSKYPEFRDGVIFCALNTEDPDIPCNDDVVFPSKPRPASINRRTQSETNNPSFHGKDSAPNQSSGKYQSTVKRVTKRLGESILPSQARGPDVGLNRAVDEFGIKYETSRAEACTGPRSSCQNIQAVKKEPLELPLARQPGCCAADKPDQVVDFGHLPSAVGGNNLEAQTSSALRNQELHAPSAECIAAEPGGEPLLSDPEEQFSESDTDIPSFSDVESMILDMDLGSEARIFNSCREVTKYRGEEATRTIMRLEQHALSYMKRALASHSSLAILYGRHSKHYIKKPEVMLGRAAEDYTVDIDLGREGRANKISRKQAIIKMREDGAFYIQNHAKKPIYVNNSEVGLNQSLALESGCMIEIRGMPFIFEANEARIKQYLNNATHKLEDKTLNT